MVFCRCRSRSFRYFGNCQLIFQGGFPGFHRGCVRTTKDGMVVFHVPRFVRSDFPTSGISPLLAGRLRRAYLTRDRDLICAQDVFRDNVYNVRRVFLTCLMTLARIFQFFTFKGLRWNISVYVRFFKGRQFLCVIVNASFVAFCRVFEECRNEKRRGQDFPVYLTSALRRLMAIRGKRFCVECCRVEVLFFPLFRTLLTVNNDGRFVATCRVFRPTLGCVSRTYVIFCRRWLCRGTFVVCYGGGRGGRYGDRVTVGWAEGAAPLGLVLA